MGKRKGDSFIAQPPFEILIALVFTFLVIGFIIAQSGGINSILDGICDKIPALCTGKVSTVDYESAKQSTQMLKCAIDTVFTGDEQCAGIIKNSPNGATVTGNAAADATATQNSQTQTQSAPSDASLYCDLKSGYPELEYDEDCGTLNPACDHENVWYVFDSGEWKSKCPDCGEKFYEYKTVSSMNSMFSGVDEIHLWIGNEIGAIDKNQPEKSRYSAGIKILEQAVVRGGDDEIIIHHKNEKSETLTIDNINNLEKVGLEKDAKCTIKNFQLPQIITDESNVHKVLFEGLGDPQFILYWQRFPEGEDVGWTKLSTWMENAETVFMYALPVSEIFGAGKRFVVGKVKDLASKSKNMVSKLVSKLIGKSTQEAEEQIIVAYGKKKLAGKIIGTKVISEGADGLATYYLSKEIGNSVLEKAVKEALDKGESTAIAKVSELVKKDFEKLDVVKKTGILNKFMGTKAFTPAWEDYARALKVTGLAAGIDFLGYKLDAINDKFYEKPGSLVLQKRTLFTNEAEEFKVSRFNVPIILLKDYSFLQKEIAPAYVPFYLASPCKADLQIIKSPKPVPCGSYKYDIESKSIECLPRDSQGYSERIEEGPFDVCENLPFSHVEMNKYTSTDSTGLISINKDNMEKDKNLKAEIASKETTLITDITAGNKIPILQNDIAVPSYTLPDKYIHIKEPVTDLDFYYNPKTNAIEYVGKNNEVHAIDKPPFDITDLSKYDIFELGNLGSGNNMGFVDKSDFILFTYRLKDLKSVIEIPDYGETTYIVINITKSEQKVNSVEFQSITTPDILTIAHKLSIVSWGDEDGNLEGIVHKKLVNCQLRSDAANVEQPIFFNKDCKEAETRTFTKYAKLGTNCIVNDALLIYADQSPYSSEKHNYCYTKPSGAATAIFAGTMIADIVLQIVVKKPGARLFSSVVINAMGGTAQVYAKHTTDWPGN
ncbi:MAG: hypothetical protein NTU57_05225 [Candidatus Aenigmarchaeota archaeon]|nr:hypothetical protein [Candidatus Aenigmarchaeota archaeon]